MLMSLEQVKKALNIPCEDTSNDDFLISQINLISEAMELYCGRKFNLASYTQEFYKDEIAKDIVSEIFLYHYPVVNIVSIQQDGEDITEYRTVKSTGLIRKRTGLFISYDSPLTVMYSAGYQTLPYTLQEVLTSLVRERYNKKVAGVDLNFGSDVQRISIPGTISIDYDYTLENNSQGVALGILVGTYANVLDQFKSERKVVGTLREGYVY
jgi:hypothetical protein